MGFGTRVRFTSEEPPVELPIGRSSWIWLKPKGPRSLVWISSVHRIDASGGVTTAGSAGSLPACVSPAGSVSFDGSLGAGVCVPMLPVLGVLSACCGRVVAVRGLFAVVVVVVLLLLGWLLRVESAEVVG